jgi:hypothetical protein
VAPKNFKVAKLLIIGPSSGDHATRLGMDWVVPPNFVNQNKILMLFVGW